MPGGRLTRQDRQRVAAGLVEGLGYAEIGRRLGRPTSTISREVARNGGPDGYRADDAYASSARRAQRRRSSAPADAPPTLAGYGRDPQAAQRFVEQFAALMVQTGLPRMAARVFACLVTTDAGALTAAELVQWLRVSPASVSKAIGYLEGLGLARRERDAHRRRERYSIEDDLWLHAWTTDTQRHANLAGVARQGAEILGAATPAGARLRQMGQFFAQLAAKMDSSPITEATYDDALTLVAALFYARAPLTVGQLASALGWPAERVCDALRAAERYPDIAGAVALQRMESGAYTIGARRDRLSATQRAALGVTSAGREPSA